MSPEEAMIGAKALLEKCADKPTFKVSVDSPVAYTLTVKAFKKLGCKVKAMKDGKILMITHPPKPS